MQFLRSRNVRQTRPYGVPPAPPPAPIVPVVLLLALVAWQWIFAVANAARLPTRYPVHFGLSGQPDRWATGSGEWYVLPIAATFIGLLLTVLGLAASRMPPSLVNLPERARFLALPRDEQRRVLGVVASFSATLGVGVEALFAALQYLVFRVAMGEADGLRPDLMGGLVGGFLVLSLVGALRLRGRVRRAIEAAERPGGGRGGFGDPTG